MLLLGWGWAILSPPCSLFIPEAYALGQRKESRRAGREGLAWREKGPAPSLTRSYSRSGGKGVSPDLGVRGSGSSGAKPRGASGSRATSLVSPLHGGVGVGVGVCGCPCVFPQPPSSHHRGKKLEEGRKRSTCRGPHAPPSCQGFRRKGLGLTSDRA